MLTIIECIYILKYVELNHRHETNPWSIRRQIRHYLTTNRINKAQDPFAIQLLVLNVVVATWRRYLIYIAKKVRQQVSWLFSSLSNYCLKWQR